MTPDPCTHCATQPEPGDRFCMECGKELPEPGEPTEREPATERSRPIETVAEYLKANGFPQLAARFEDERIELDQLPSLDDDDLQAIGVEALGDRKRLLALFADPASFEVEIPIAFGAAVGSDADSLATGDSEAEHDPVDALVKKVTWFVVAFIASVLVVALLAHLGGSSSSTSEESAAVKACKRECNNSSSGHWRGVGIRPTRAMKATCVGFCEDNNGDCSDGTSNGVEACVYKAILRHR